MTTGAKKWVIVGGLIALLTVGPLIMWQGASPAARMQASLTWPLWPNSRERLIEGGGDTVRDCLEFLASKPKYDLEDRTYKIIAAIPPPVSIPVLYECRENERLRGPAFNAAVRLSPVALKVLLRMSLEGDNRVEEWANRHINDIFAMGDENEKHLPKKEMDEVLELFRRVSHKSSRGMDRTFAFGMSQWAFDDGEYVAHLSKSSDPRDREIAAATCSKVIDSSMGSVADKPAWRDSMHRTLYRLLDDPEPKVAAIAAYAACRLDFSIADRSSVEKKLLAFMESGDLDLRVRTFRSVRRLLPGKAKDYAFQMENSADSITREAAQNYFDEERERMGMRILKQP